METLALSSRHQALLQKLAEQHNLSPQTVAAGLLQRKLDIFGNARNELVYRHLTFPEALAAVIYYSSNLKEGELPLYPSVTVLGMLTGRTGRAAGDFCNIKSTKKAIAIARSDLNLNPQANKRFRCKNCFEKTVETARRRYIDTQNAINS